MHPVVDAICRDIADARATRQSGRISTPVAREICQQHYGQVKGLPKDEILRICDELLLDKHDLVRKGYGWMLKEVSNKDPKLIYDFVMARKRAMPRVSLRYAIEKLDPESRKELMA